MLRNRGFLAGLLWLVCLQGSAFAAEMGHLEAEFVRPPATARPWVYWLWIDGNVSREGISADLEAMQRVGIGGAFLLDITQELPDGKVGFFSPQWRSLFQHTIKEADRLGLRIGIYNAAGWTGSGGPWIEPSNSMQRLIYSVTNVVGPARFHDTLPPLTESPDHWPVATIAFPSVVGDLMNVPGVTPRFTTSGNAPIPSALLLDGGASTFVSLAVPTRKKPQHIQAEYSEPFTANRLVMTSTPGTGQFQGSVLASDDGRSFRTLREFSSAGTQLSLEFSQTRARIFRVVISGVSGRGSLEIAEFGLTPVYRINGYTTRAGMGRFRDPENGSSPYDIQGAVPDGGIISADKTVDLTSATDPAGRLTWEVPPGRWTIMRFGFMPTGRVNHPARPGGLGLECDKLRKEAVEKHFQAFLGQLIQENSYAAGAAFRMVNIESWEVGYQNWTPAFRDEFRKRRGYDLLPWLPAFSGRIVAGNNQSARFFWDVRTTIAEMQAESHAGHMRFLANQHGLELSVEAYGEGPFNPFVTAGRADIPMSEFRHAAADNARTHYSRMMASAAHTYGKKVVAAEAFGAYPDAARWQNHPFTLKALGDAIFCAGVNHFIIHRYTHQPWLGVRPGMTMGDWGIHYERTQTWWEQSKPWHEYLARCQHLLQSGVFVADLAYLVKEEAYYEPPSFDTLSPAVPAGYSFDWIAPDAVLTRATVKDGQMVLPDGVSYSVIVLPQTDRMTPALLRKLIEFVAGGVTIVGAPPGRSPSLQDYPACDDQVRRLASTLWGKSDGKAVMENSHGKGRVVFGKDLPVVLQELALPPDFQQMTPPNGFPLNWIHRRLDSGDLYFVANSNTFPVFAECAFRVVGKEPEIWHPDTGRIESAPIWRSTEHHTIVPLNFGPAGSVFVVFRKPSATQPHPTGIARAGKALTTGVELRRESDRLELSTSEPGTYSVEMSSGPARNVTVPVLSQPLRIEGPWEVTFPTNLGAPTRIRLERLINLASHPDPGVKYFSGTATYRARFQVPEALAGENAEFRLDLGNVQVIAEPQLNGGSLGILWKPPFIVDATSALRPGENEIVVKIVNLWPNRLIGDEQLPEDCTWRSPESRPGKVPAAWPEWLLAGNSSPAGRVTFATWKLWPKDSPLLPSGLLGPVTLRPVARVKVE